MRWVTDILYLLGLLVGSPWFIFRMITAGKYRRGLGQRLGNVPFTPDGRPLIWVHAVSVGELQLAEPLVRALAAKYPGHQVVISHTTRTGEEVAAKLYPDLARFYAPLDFSWVVARVFRRLRPALVILVELELWPNFLGEARRRNVPVLLVNGRIGERSARGYGRFAWFFRGPFSAITSAGMQNEDYHRRLTDLYRRMGLDTAKVRITGNLKYDRAPAELDPAQRTRWRRMFAVPDNELLLVCGSTHPGEHELLPGLYRDWRDAGTHLRMVVVPRHPERWNAVRDAFRSAGVPLLDRSTLNESRPVDPAVTRDGLPPVILLDAMGELSSLYHAADIVFVGGSLIPHGGQNMIEPAALGLPVITGPHTHNFPSVMRELRAAGGVIEVQDAVGLRAAVKGLAGGSDRRRELGEAARKVVHAGRGSLGRYLELVQEILGCQQAHARPTVDTPQQS